MKKLIISVAVAGLSVSLGSYAGLPTGAAPFQSNIPNFNSGFEFNLTGLYLRPSSDDLEYANVTTTLANNVTNIDGVSVKPGYKPGFDLGVGYIFPNSGNDVQLHWTHLNATSRNSVLGQSVNPPQVSTQDATAANASAEFNYNAVDLNAGQYTNFGTRLQMRFFGGLRYANIKRDFDSNFINVGGINTSSTAFEQLSKTWGIGPRLGVDSQYHLCHRWGVVASVAASLLYGNVKHDENIVQTTLSSTTTSYLRPDDSTRAIPEFDGKLGLNYSYVIEGSILTVEGGYQAIHYFNAIDSVTGTAINYTGSIDRSSESVSFGGPYLGLTLKM